MDPRENEILDAIDGLGRYAPTPAGLPPLGNRAAPRRPRQVIPGALNNPHPPIGPRVLNGNNQVLGGMLPSDTQSFL
jgi:hypothetical protein